ncbi:MAG: sulfatase, partial [Parabacteroides sp.]
MIMLKNILTIGSMLLSLGVSHAQSTGKKPNIILIMADDMGWGDVGFNGNRIIQTPCLDRLATEGVRMDRFYSAGPLSSPTRASVLTGRHPFRTGVFSANEGILRPEEITLPELLKQVGYTTGHFGKWHLGTLTCNEVDANRGRPDNKHLYNPPAWHGYDAAFVTESKVPTFDPMLKPQTNNGRFWDYIQDRDTVLTYGTYYWDIKGNKVSAGLAGDDSRIIMDRVLPFIDNSVAEEKPFFSVVWFHAPHLPCVAGPEHAALYPNCSLEERNYYGCITALDEQIGRLISFLKNKQIYENTILLFCSDNGPELNTPGSAGNYKGKKRSLHEGGIRVPAFMVWPEQIKTSLILEEPCSTSDYLPSLLDMVGIPYPAERELDGESFWPLITGKQSAKQKDLVFCS